MLAKLTRVALISSLGGCYFNYPHDIRQKAPPVTAGARIEIDDSDGVDYFHDCDHNRGGCILRDGELVRPSPYISTTATYNGKPITRGEILELVAPKEQAAKWAEVTQYEGTCSLSLVPSVAFAVGALADLAGVGAISATSSNIPVYMLVGGAALMVAGAALSYPIGGYACNHGRDVAQRSGVDYDNSIRWVTRTDEPAGVEREKQLRAAVVAYNARSGGGADDADERAHHDKLSPHDDKADTATSSVPEPASFSGDLTAGLAADPTLSTFSRLLAVAGVEEVLEPGNHYTIYAPTNDALAAGGVDIDALLAAKTKKDRRHVRDLVQAYVAQMVEPLATTLERGFTANRAGSNLHFAREHGRVTVEGFPIVGKPVATSNGVIYPLGPK